jgi:uncharacterized membrane protein
MRSGWFLVSIIATLLALAAGLAVWAGWFGPLPEQVPTHWDLHGKPDHFVPRDQAWPYLFIAPGAMALFVILTLVFPWLSPRSFDVERFRPTYHYIMALVVLLMGYIQVVVLLSSLGVPMPFLKVYMGGIFLFFAALGNVLGKVQRNFWMGVRTPWTLASETVWIRTHRLAAWLFVVGGLAGFVAAMLDASPWVGLGILAVPCLVPVIYSLVLYKQLEKRGLLDGPPQPPAQQP